MCLDKNANITHKYFQIVKIYTKNKQKSKRKILNKESKNVCL